MVGNGREDMADGYFRDLWKKITTFLHTIRSRCATWTRTMACVSVTSMHAVARMPLSTARSRRPFETTRVTLPRSPDSFHVVSNRAVHLDGPGTKARACSWRHADAHAFGDGTEQRVYTFGSRNRSPPAGACLPRTRLFTISPANCQSGRSEQFRKVSAFSAMAGNTGFR